MKKKITAVAALVMSLSVLSACGKEDPENSVAGVIEEVTTSATTAETTTDTTAATTETEATATTTDYIGFSDEDFVHQVDVPEFDVDNSVTREDFNGKWECAIMAEDDIAYDEIMSIPLYAILRAEITADEDIFHMITPEGAYGSEEEEEDKAPFVFENGRLVISEPVDDDDDEYSDEDGEEEIVYAYINKDGMLVMTDDEQTDLIYFKRVDSFTEYDWSDYEKKLEDFYGDLDSDVVEDKEDEDVDIDD